MNQSNSFLGQLTSIVLKLTSDARFDYRSSQFRVNLNLGNPRVMSFIPLELLMFCSLFTRLYLLSSELKAARAEE